MNFEKLKQYVERVRKEGYSDKEIRLNLVNTGWPQDMIERALSKSPTPNFEGIKISNPFVSNIAHKDSRYNLSNKTLSRNFNFLAIISIVFTFVFPIVGIILGFIALKQIKKNNERGKGFAIVGIVGGFIMIILSVLFVFSSFFVQNLIKTGSGELSFSTNNNNEILTCGNDIDAEVLVIGQDKRMCLSEDYFMIYLSNTGIKEIDDWMMNIVGVEGIDKKIYSNKLEIGGLGVHKIYFDSIKTGKIDHIQMYPRIYTSSGNPIDCVKEDLYFEEFEIIDCNDVIWDNGVQ